LQAQSKKKLKIQISFLTIKR